MKTYGCDSDPPRKSKEGKVAGRQGRRDRAEESNSVSEEEREGRRRRVRSRSASFSSTFEPTKGDLRRETERELVLVSMGGKLDVFNCVVQKVNSKLRGGREGRKEGGGRRGGR